MSSKRKRRRKSTRTSKRTRHPVLRPGGVLVFLWVAGATFLLSLIAHDLAGTEAIKLLTELASFTGMG
ncbi:MAG: hypothetical protein AAGI08_00240 [Bacteroidota bacterium]